MCTATFAYNYDLNKHKKRFHRDHNVINRDHGQSDDVENGHYEDFVVKEQKRQIPRLLVHNPRSSSSRSFNNAVYNPAGQTEAVTGGKQHSSSIMKMELPSTTAQGHLVKDTIYIVKDMATGQVRDV